MAAMIARAQPLLALIGLGWLAPLFRIALGGNRRRELAEVWLTLGVPIVAIALFLALWSAMAARLTTSLGALPDPKAVWQEAGNLLDAHRAERARRADFYARQEARNAAARVADPAAARKIRQYTGKPTYIDQIVTSLATVFTGFVLAALVAVPLGIVAGLSRTVNAAINPIVQIFKPVSPLAWLPIVTIVVSAAYTSATPLVQKSFLTSAVTVTLCSLWPALINTSLGVASIDKDLLNVGRVLELGWFAKVFKIVLPSALPLIFTGLRLSLGVAWMVLIAAEMLAQNPGLGKFVWDEFQNGSSASLARIFVAVLTIGGIGFLLDRVMLALQAACTHTVQR
jgi:nitrate/nitrite transport system permease protein